MPKKGNKRAKKLRGRGAYYAGGRVLRGKGGFFDDVGNFFCKAVGPLLGAAGTVADTIWPGSGLVAQGIRRLIGKGAYVGVRSNAILAQPVPSVGSRQDYGITYSHCEYLGDVTGSTDWELTQFKVNPGLPETFPWLAGLAGNFQKYRVDGLIFYLKSTSSVAIANTENLGLGTVLGGFQYNPYDRAPGSKAEFLALSGSVSGKPSEDHIYPLECDRSKNVFGNLLVRTVGVSDDLAKYDHATFNLATVGFPGEYYLGELWVSYRVVLMAPKIEAGNSSLLLSAEAKSPSISDPLINGLLWPMGSPDGGTTDYLVCTAPVDDAAVFDNTLGLSIGTGSDGLPCYLVPAGTVGHFQFRLLMSMLNSSSGVVTKPWTDVSGENFFSVVDSTGEVEVLDLATASKGFFAQSLNAAAAVTAFPTSTYTGFLRINALPDKPLKLRIAVNAGMSGGTGGAPAKAYGFCELVRMPEKFFANTAVDGVVTLAQKVQRVHLARGAARQAAVAASGLEAKVPAPPTPASSCLGGGSVDVNSEWIRSLQSDSGCVEVVAAPTPLRPSASLPCRAVK
jgi:hypothetical protein